LANESYSFYDILQKYTAFRLLENFHAYFCLEGSTRKIRGPNTKNGAEYDSPKDSLLSVYFGCSSEPSRFMIVSCILLGPINDFELQPAFL